MPEFYVPDRIKPIVARIQALEDPDFERIRASLESAKPGVSVEHLVAEVSKALPGEFENVDEIIHALDSMNRARLHTNRTIEQFVHGMVGPVENQAESAPPFDSTKFFARVSALLEC